MTDADPLAVLVRGIRAGDRRLLARAITLVESSQAGDAAEAREVLKRLGPGSDNGIRIGVTGAPGAGKSTLIDVLGRHATERGKRVAVLAVDPSSVASGGSVLGDKTRMVRLATLPDTFIRPSPTRGVLGGTTRHTREAITLCEAAGYDLIFVETVGVGQSEQAVASLVDSVLLVVLADAGDELSAIKRGLSEVTDIVVLNKADGERRARAELRAAELRTAARVGRAGRDTWQPPVVLTSALEESGIEELWAALAAHREHLEGSGRLRALRQDQRRAALSAALDAGLKDAFSRDQAVAAAYAAVEQHVLSGALSPNAGAERLLELFLDRARSG
jgi:LAO/AO transport system kinase